MKKTRLPKPGISASWRFCWVGFHWDERLRLLVVHPIPCFGPTLQFYDAWGILRENDFTQKEKSVQGILGALLASLTALAVAASAILVPSSLIAWLSLGLFCMALWALGSQ
jgi:hypothetical protein